jgi:hypothetical protein
VKKGNPEKYRSFVVPYSTTVISTIALAPRVRARIAESYAAGRVTSEPGPQLDGLAATGYQGVGSSV